MLSAVYPSPMSGVSLVRRGLRVAFREPAIVLAEIAWRWTFGLAALVLVTASAAAFLHTILVSNVELLALTSKTPVLIADALVHIFRGSGSRLLRIVVILTPALSLLWVVTASLGRAATLKTLLGREEGPAMAPLFGLHFLRAALGLAALIAYVGAAILAGLAATAGPVNRPGVFLLVFLGLSLVITLIRSRISWFLFLGAIFAGREGRDTFAAIADAGQFFRRHLGSFLATGTWFAVLRGFNAGVATVVSLAPLALIGRVRGALVAVLLVLVALVYSAFADFLYVARLAAYVALAEQERAPAPSTSAPAAPEPAAPAAPPHADPAALPG